MGERRARWGYGYQDKVATDRILKLLRKDCQPESIDFEGVRLADLDAGRADDFVLVWKKKVEGNSIKWSGEATPINWGDLIGSNGLLKELADGYHRLKDRWPDKGVSVRLQSNRPASREMHHSQLISTFSVDEFLKNHWSAGPTTNDPSPIADAWLKISKHVGLTGSELAKFVVSCDFTLGYQEPPGMGPESFDWQYYKKQFDDLHKAIATWLTNNPTIDFIDNYALLSFIKAQSHQSGLIQRFPLPKIPYSKNAKSGEQLKHFIDTNEGGYIAVVGNAGIGKSTLVQDVLSNAQYPIFIPYYAFLPETEGNRDRGEALTFFQDIIGRLDKLFPHRHSVGISEIAQGREALRGHMSKAKEHYAIHGHKTILLIDGLDHVSREINLQQTLLHELPSPNEVPDGFLIILSSQPQALIPGTITPSVGTVVAEGSGRRIEISGLTRPEVYAILKRISKPTTGSESDKLYNACIGNPLILTYLLNIYTRAPEITVEKAIKLAGNFEDDIEKYYQSTLSVPLQDAQTRQLMGLLCRAAPTIPVDWLHKWPEKSQLEHIYEYILAPFMAIEDGNLQFIHNSLIAFLKYETRSRLPGANFNENERTYHLELADRCGDRPCVDPLGRAKVLHLSKAKKDTELLSVLSSDWIRHAIEAFLPYALIQPLILSGLRAAWDLGKIGHVLRLVLLAYELDQRTSRMEPGDIAKVFLELDRPEMAVSQIRAVGRLLAADNVALEFSRSLWLYADAHDRPDLKDKALTLYLQAKPVSFIHQKEPLDTQHQHEFKSTLQAWSEAAPIFEDCRNIVAQIKRLHFKVDTPEEENQVVGFKVNLLYSVLLGIIYFDSRVDQHQLLLDEISDMGLPIWRYAALLTLGHDTLPNWLEDIESAYEKSAHHNDLNLVHAELLYHHGKANAAKEIIKNLTHIRFGPILDNKHSLGFTDISYTVTLRYLQDLLNVPEGLVPDAKNNSEEAYARIETAARTIGALFAVVKKGATVSHLNTALRSLLLFHNQKVAFSEFDWRENHAVSVYKEEIYRQIIRLTVAIGKIGFESLREVLLGLVDGPAGSQFTSHHRRYFAKELFFNGALTKDQAVKLGLSSTLDANISDDPMQRQEACCAISTFLHKIGENASSQKWLKRAGEVSAGAGSHKDYHMASLAKWLCRSVRYISDFNKLSILEKFARAVQVAGGDGTSRAATNQLQLVFEIAPTLAYRFAIELIDREILNVPQALKSLVLKGASIGISKELLIAVYCELVSLIDYDGDTSEAAIAVLRCFSIENRVNTSKIIMNSVRTNSLPSYRIIIARAIQDALRQDGLGENIMTQGLKVSSHDSSSKNSLYKFPNGELETLDQIADRLSSCDNLKDWNSTLSENGQFDWWEAIKKTKIKNLCHLNELLSYFPPPEYRKTELLAWKSEKLLEFGDDNNARLLAEQAVDCAKDNSWHKWYDGAQKKVAYGALMRIDKQDALFRAREHFGKDLAEGRINFSTLLNDIVDLFDFLEFEWPSENVCEVIDDYINAVLAANKDTSLFESLSGDLENRSADESLVRFLVHLLAFPVIDVGIAARRALANYVGADGHAIVSLINGISCWDSVQLEHILISLHVGLRCRKNFIGAEIKDWISRLNLHESIAVRSIARRISEEQGWQWDEIREQDKCPVVLIPKSQLPSCSFEEAQMVVGGDEETSFRVFRFIFNKLMSFGHNPNEIKSEFHILFQKIRDNFRWTDETRLKTWMNLVRAQHWLPPRIIVGREAAMKVFGRRALSGQVPSGAEQSYDHLYPIYDPKLEICKPIERPVELNTIMGWDRIRGENDAWLKGENADSWDNYPKSIDGLYIIGERSWFIRPEWEWPREERRRGLIPGPCDTKVTQECLYSSHPVTYELYLRGYSQNITQLIVLNDEAQLSGSMYRWAAINSSFAHSLGWHLSDSEPFTWVDSSGDLMVKSIFWKDGWIWLAPPEFEPLGEGWLVLATEQGIKAICGVFKNCELHLWVERHSHGSKRYVGKWHLSKSIVGESWGQI